MVHLKQCPSCLKRKPEHEFALDKFGRRRAFCAQCVASYKNPSKKAHYERLRTHLKRARSVPCSDCGERYPYYVMDFDHVRGEKSFNIGRFFNQGRGGRTLRVLLDELAKCDVVCANCHRERTHGEKLREEAEEILEQVFISSAAA